MKSNKYKRLLNNEGALINTDVDALKEYKKAKQRFKKMNEIPLLEKRIETLENLIKQMLENKIDS